MKYIKLLWGLMHIVCVLSNNTSHKIGRARIASLWEGELRSWSNLWEHSMGPITPLYSTLVKNFPLPPARWIELQETSVKVYFNILMEKKKKLLSFRESVTCPRAYSLFMAKPDLLSPSPMSCTQGDILFSNPVLSWPLQKIWGMSSQRSSLIEILALFHRVLYHI